MLRRWHIVAVILLSSSPSHPEGLLFRTDGVAKDRATDDPEQPCNWLCRKWLGAYAPVEKHEEAPSLSTQPREEGSRGEITRNAGTDRANVARQRPVVVPRQPSTTRMALTMLPPPRPRTAYPSEPISVEASEVVTQTGSQRDVDRPTLLPVLRVETSKYLVYSINVRSISASCLAAHFKTLQTRELSVLLQRETNFDQFRFLAKRLPGSIELSSLRDLFGPFETDMLPCDPATGAETAAIIPPE